MILIPLEEYRKEPEEHSPSPEGPRYGDILYRVRGNRQNSAAGQRPFYFF